MDATFKYEIGQKSVDLFEEVLKQFEVEDETEYDVNDFQSETATMHGQSMGTITTRHQKNQEVQKKTKIEKEKLKDLNMLEHAYTQEHGI